MTLNAPNRAALGSSEWWIAELTSALDERTLLLDKFDDYYRGNQPLRFATDAMRDAFGGLFRAFADNYCALVVDATEERLNVEGFRFGEENGDSEAWRIWQSNNLDSMSQLAHLEALIKGTSYVMVWGTDDGTPVITVEDASQTIVAYDAENRWRRRAGLKRWQDESGYLFLNLYLPDRIEKLRTPRPMDVSLLGVVWAKQEWVEREPTMANPMGEVPIIPLINRPRLVGEGESEIAPILPLQDFVNKILMDALIASEFGSFRQRWATGIEIPEDENGNPVEPFKAAVDRIWVTSSPEVKFGDFAQTDLSGHIKLIETGIQHIASISRTPPHYLLGQSGSFPSGESLKATETGLTAKVMRKQRYFGEAWEDAMRLAFRWLDDPRAAFPQAETIWRDAEYRAPGQWADALTKLKTIGVPDRALWEEWGASPQKIARWEQLRMQQSLLSGPTVAPAAPEAVPVVMPMTNRDGTV